jgi:hypothetical protein
MVAIHRRDQIFELRLQCGRVVRNADQQICPPQEGERLLRETQVYCGRRILVQSGLPDIADHTHNLRPARIVWIGPNGADPLPQGAGAGKEPPRKSLICHCHQGGVRRIGRGKRPAFEQRHPHDAEVIQTYVHQRSRGTLARRWSRLVLNLKGPDIS